MESRPSPGLLIGIVTDLEDPENLGRVKVKFPTLGDQASDWVRLATLMAGPNRGTFFCPEKDDELLIGFEHNDLRRPYMVGALWSKVDPPPPDDGQRKKNNWRFIQSRSGHIIKLDDTQGAEKIELIDKDGLRKVVIDSANNNIQVLCRQGNVEVEASSGAVNIKASASNVSIEAPAGNVSIKGLTVSVEATSSLTLKGSVVNIN